MKPDKYDIFLAALVTAMAFLVAATGYALGSLK